MNKNKLLYTIAVISIICLCTYILFTYNRPYKKDFFMDAFYTGKHEYKETDIRKQYLDMKGNKKKKDTVDIDNICDITPTKSKNPTITANNAYWIIDNKELPEDLSQSTFAGFSDGDLLVSPSSIRFVNSNINIKADNTIDIQFTCGSYIFILSNVKNWYCHKDSTETVLQHTVVIGAGSSNDTELLQGGFIIGTALNSTVLSIYKYDENIGDKVEVSLSEFYNGEHN